ncbi:NUDIX domain-containing protein [Microbacterium sp.]|uniref:arsenate reductase/protein-tyrosine-phosphatase family protein n=1 Tax=Microbacterium sp. TaxID=51671 RepID=UPI003C78F324
MLTWGRSAAGLLVADRGRVLLQHRAAWVQHGGTWSIPGGALATGETAVDAALREAREESGLTPDDVRLTGAEHVAGPVPGWTYTTVVARLRKRARSLGTPPASAEATRHEWVPLGDVGGRNLHPGFAASWPEVRRLVDERRRPPRVLFVCSGNICRSPLAELLLRRMARESGVAVEVASAGVAAHVGEPMDDGAAACAARHGLDGSAHVARQFTAADAARYDLLVALSPAVAQSIERTAPGANVQAHWVLNPWRMPAWGHERAYEEIRVACAEVLTSLQNVP